MSPLAFIVTGSTRFEERAVKDAVCVQKAVFRRIVYLAIGGRFFNRVLNRCALEYYYY
jgi:hypothetical protein